MSNFGAKLSEILERNKMRASELSRASGLTEALISRWVSGKQVYVSNKDLDVIVTTISSVPTDRAELIRAHLLDEMAGPGRELIQIHIVHDGQALCEETAPYRVPLPPKAMRAFDILMAEYPADSDVRATIHGLANIIAGDDEQKLHDEVRINSAEAPPAADDAGKPRTALEAWTKGRPQRSTPLAAD